MLLVNISAKAESLLHTLEQEVGGIGFRVYANKTEYMNFKREGSIFTLNGIPQKFVDKSKYLGSSD